MPKITVNGKTGEFPANRRLVQAIEELGIEIGHRCGGKARCTTCRVEFTSGEPDEMTEAEYFKLKEKGLLGQVRLSCQILCEHDMEVEPKQTKQSAGWADTGPAVADEVEPEPKWYSEAVLVARGD
jgi:ferredoxin